MSMRQGYQPIGSVALKISGILVLWLQKRQAQIENTIVTKNSRKLLHDVLGIGYMLKNCIADDYIKKAIRLWNIMNWGIDMNIGVMQAMRDVLIE